MLITQIMRRPIMRYVFVSLHILAEGSVSLGWKIQCPFSQKCFLLGEREQKGEEGSKKEENKPDEKEEDLVEAMAKLRIAPSTTVRTKSLAKVNEDQDVDQLIALLQEGVGKEKGEEKGEEKGKELCRLFQETFPGKEIIGAKRGSGSGPAKKAGGRSVHYDFLLHVRDKETGHEEWLRVEHKGSSLYKPLDASCPPWTGGVQFFNGGMEKYRLCRKYAEAWYERFIGSGFLSVEYGVLDEEIPSSEEWIQRDARVQGDPKTAFGKALKRAVRDAGKESLRDLRDVFVPDFVSELTEQDKAEFLEDVAPILRESLGQKDVWLQVAGDVATGQFHARWSPALRVSSVSGVEWESRKDVVGVIHTDCAHPIQFILRWGKGAGFSNLRLDLK